MSKEVVAEVIALIELGMIAPDDIVKCLRKANSEPENALAEQPAQQEPVDVDFMRQVLSVAIAGLHQHYKDDVLRVFTLDDLQTVVDLSEPLQSQNVEDIYKRAWAMLAAAPQPAQQEPVAWRAPNWGHSDDEWVYRDFDDPVLIADGKPSPNNEPLYTSPPAQQDIQRLSALVRAQQITIDKLEAQRKPLTDEVKNKFWREAIKYGVNGQSMNWQKAADFYADAIEAAHGIKENT